jgi:hypothetical protein
MTTFAFLSPTRQTRINAQIHHARDAIDELMEANLLTIWNVSSRVVCRLADDAVISLRRAWAI